MGGVKKMITRYVSPKLNIVIDTYLVYLMTALGYKKKQNSFI